MKMELCWDVWYEKLGVWCVSEHFWAKAFSDALHRLSNHIKISIIVILVTHRPVISIFTRHHVTSRRFMEVRIDLLRSRRTKRDTLKICIVDKYLWEDSNDERRYLRFWGLSEKWYGTLLILIPQSQVDQGMVAPIAVGTFRKLYSPRVICLQLQNRKSFLRGSIIMAQKRT